MHVTSVRWALILICVAACSQVGGDGDATSPADSSSGQPADAAVAGGAAAASGAAGAGGGSGARLPEPGTGGTKLLPKKDARFMLGADQVTTMYDGVVYQPNAIVLEGDAVDALTDHDAKAHRYTFDRAKLAALGVELVKGKPLMISGLALRRIDSVSTSGGKVTVTTSPASLADVIKDGTVGWKAKLAFDSKHLAAFTLPSDDRGPSGDPMTTVLASRAQTGAWNAAVARTTEWNGPAGNEMKWTFDKAGLTYEFNLRQKGDKADFLVKATRASGASGQLQYWAKGTMSAVMVNAKGEYREGTLKTLEYDQPEMVGDVEIALAAAGAGGDEINFTLPSALLKYVVMVGPVPIVFEISAKMIGRVKVPSKGSATAKAKFSYGGKAGFKYEGTSVEAEGVFHKMTFAPNPADSAAMIGQPVDAQWGIAIPRVSAAAFGTFFIPYFQPGVVIGSRLQWGPVCKSAYVKFTADYGYDFEVMGVKMAGKKHNLYRKEQTAPKGGCPKKK